MQWMVYGLVWIDQLFWSRFHLADDGSYGDESEIWYVILLYLLLYFVFELRSLISMTADLEGGGCGACCKAFWCGCCMNIQMSKELDYIQLQQQQKIGYVSGPGMVAKSQY